MKISCSCDPEEENSIVQRNQLSKIDQDPDTNQVQYVGIGEVKLGLAGDILKITSLGSCIGLILHPKSDRLKRCAIMGHIMLPSVGKGKIRKAKWPMTRFADIAVPTMITQIEEVAENKLRREIMAIMIGGAEMFGVSRITMRIGRANASMTKTLLNKAGIRVIKEFVGGDSGMSVNLDVSRYITTVKPTGGKEIRIWY